MTMMKLSNILLNAADATKKLEDKAYKHSKKAQEKLGAAKKKSVEKAKEFSEGHKLDDKLTILTENTKSLSEKIHDAAVKKFDDAVDECHCSENEEKCCSTVAPVVEEEPVEEEEEVLDETEAPETVDEIFDRLMEDAEHSPVAVLTGKSKSRLDALSRKAKESGIEVLKLSTSSAELSSGKTKLERSYDSVRLFLNGFRNYNPSEKKVSFVAVDARDSSSKVTKDLLKNILNEAKLQKIITVIAVASKDDADLGFETFTVDF